MPKKYIANNYRIEAVQYVGANLNEMRDFLGMKSIVVQRRLRVYLPSGAAFAEEGDWVIRSEYGHVMIMSNEMFRTHYVRIPDNY